MCSSFDFDSSIVVLHTGILKWASISEYEVVAVAIPNACSLLVWHS